MTRKDFNFSSVDTSGASNFQAVALSFQDPALNHWVEKPRLKPAQRFLDEDPEMNDFLRFQQLAFSSVPFVLWPKVTVLLLAALGKWFLSQ